MSPSRPTVRVPSVGASCRRSGAGAGLQPARLRAAAAATASAALRSACASVGGVSRDLLLGVRDELTGGGSRRRRFVGIGDRLQDVDDGVRRRCRWRRARGSRPAIAGKSESGMLAAEVVADAGPAEDLLDDDDAGEDEAELQPGHRERGVEGVAQRRGGRAPPSRSRPFERAVRTWSARERHRCSRRRIRPMRWPARSTGRAPAAADVAAPRRRIGLPVQQAVEDDEAGRPGSSGPRPAPAASRAGDRRAMIPPSASRNGGAVAPTAAAHRARSRPPGQRSAPEKREQRRQDQAR